jgi:hypothetical protein
VLVLLQPVVHGRDQPVAQGRQVPSRTFVGLPAEALQQATSGRAVDRARLQQRVETV